MMLLTGVLHRPARRPARPFSFATRPWQRPLTLVCCAACLWCAAARGALAAEEEQHPSDATPQETAKDADWRKLFDGQSLEGWEESDFGGQGGVYVEDGKLVLDFGYPLTGVRLQRPFPTSDYELQLEARREQGTDFFCGLTFPVGDGHATLIVGGWGGALVGLSSIDGEDASQNATRQDLPLERHRWYRIRLAVTKERIEVDLDGKPIIRQPRAGHRFTTRPEVNRSKPLGIASYETLAEIRNIRWRPLR